jgi:hypothetical protein
MTFELNINQNDFIQEISTCKVKGLTIWAKLRNFWTPPQKCLELLLLICNLYYTLGHEIHTRREEVVALLQVWVMVYVSTIECDGVNVVVCLSFIPFFIMILTFSPPFFLQ